MRFTTGEPARFSSSLGVHRGFCSHCGSTLTYEGERWPTEIHLHVGAFDDPAPYAPKGHAFASERLAWLHLDEPPLSNDYYCVLRIISQERMRNTLDTSEIEQPGCCKDVPCPCPLLTISVQ